ncbi:MAG TPA: winged helix-turn-helix domain-containing protein [Thermoanaerobaculia bacterium]|nr:winged helix-turn-helix domain-containing protein [Thermoanaerobaculia bacterium]
MSAPIRIGEWEFTADLHSLRKADLEVRLERKQAEVLAMLVRRPGDVLTRDEIIATVWGDVHVTEEVLTTTIYELRRVLGDDARRPRYIGTIPRRGYRLVAPVRDTQDGPASPKWRFAAAAATIILALIAVVVIGARPDSARKEAAALTARADAELDLARAASAGRALEWFDRALALHPDSAAALSGRAFARIVLVSRGEISHALADALIERDALRAIRLDPDHAGGHAALGMLRMLQWDWKAADEHLGRAVAIAPPSARARSARAEFLLLAEQPEEARRMIAAAKEFAPDSAGVLMASGFIHTMLRDDAIAIADYERVLRLDPENDDAQRQLEKLARRETAESSLDRSQLIQRVDALLRKGEVRPGIVAGMFAEAGETDRALEWLTRAREQKDLSLLLVRLDDRWKGLHSDPRLRAFLAEVSPRSSLGARRSDS